MPGAAAVRAFEMGFGAHGSTVLAYHVAGSRPVLVDLGPAHDPDGSAPAQETPLLRTLRAEGVDPAAVHHVLLTHGHHDHVGAASDLGSALGAEAAHLHEADGALAAQTVAFPAIPVVDDDVLDLGGGARIRSVHVPGHTPGSTAYLLEPTGQLFVGDAVQLGGTLGLGLPLLSEPDRYEQSMRRLLGLNASAMYLGHRFRDDEGAEVGPVVSGSATVTAALEGSLRVLDRLRAAAARPDPRLEQAAWLDAVAEHMGLPADPSLRPRSFVATLSALRPAS